MKSQTAHPAKLRNVLFIVVLMAGEWVLLVAGVKRNEMIVGLFSVMLAAAFLCLVLRTQKMELNFQLRDVCSLWRGSLVHSDQHFHPY